MLVARSVGRRDFFVGYGYTEMDPGWEWISVTVLRVSHIHSGIPPDELMACMWVEMDNILPDSTVTDSHPHAGSDLTQKTEHRSLPVLLLTPLSHVSPHEPRSRSNHCFNIVLAEIED